MTVTTSTQSPVPTQEQSAAYTTALATVAWWKDATPEQQGYLVRDCHHAVGVDGLPMEEYLEALATWGGTLHDYLAENFPEYQAATTATVTAPVPATDVQAQLAARAEEEALAREAAAEVAGKTLTAAARAFAKGGLEYAKWTLEAGRLSGEFLCQQMALGIPRDNAMLTLAGEFAKYAREVVDKPYVDRLVRVSHAHRLLAEGLEARAVAAVPYGHYRDAWIQCVETVGRGTAEEAYRLLPGLEARCREAFAKAVEGKLPKEAVQKVVSEIHRDYAAEQAKAAATAKATAKAREEEALKAHKAEQEALWAAKAEADKAMKATLDVAAKAKETKDAEEAKALEAERQRLALEAEAKGKEARAREEAAGKAKTEADKATKATEAAGKAAVKAEEAADKAAAKAEGRKPEARARTPEPQATTRPANLLDSARVGTAKDTAEMALELVTGHDNPDAVLAALLDALDGHNCLSKASKSAVKAARLAIEAAARKATAA